MVLVIDWRSTVSESWVVTVRLYYLLSDMFCSPFVPAYDTAHLHTIRTVFLHSLLLLRSYSVQGSAYLSSMHKAPKKEGPSTYNLKFKIREFLLSGMIMGEIRSQN